MLCLYISFIQIRSQIHQNLVNYNLSIILAIINQNFIVIKKELRILIQLSNYSDRVHTDYYKTIISILEIIVSAMQYVSNIILKFNHYNKIHEDIKLQHL